MELTNIGINELMKVLTVPYTFKPKYIPPQPHTSGLIRKTPCHPPANTLTNYPEELHLSGKRCWHFQETPSSFSGGTVPRPAGSRESGLAPAGQAGYGTAGFQGTIRTIKTITYTYSYTMNGPSWCTYSPLFQGINPVSPPSVSYHRWLRKHRSPHIPWGNRRGCTYSGAYPFTFQ